MSRCFPYPPPGYTPSLIESTGRRKETEKKKKKKHKRENAEKIKHSKNVQRSDDVMITKEEAERSCVTEEHCDPSNYESDCSSSPQITGKRKRQGVCSSPPDQKRLKPHHVPTSRDNLVEFATSVGRTDNDQNPACPISRQYKTMRKAALQYRDLIDNWNPPAFSVFLDADCDDDWLSATRKPVNPPEEDKSSSSCCGSTLWPPLARFLPDANIYALPYVLPF